jgi:hypothetical protein
MAFGPSSDNPGLGTGTNATPNITSGLTPSGSPEQVAAALTGFGGFSFNAWFWAILLVLLLVAISVYIYRRPLHKEKTKRM